MDGRYICGLCVSEDKIALCGNIDYLDYEKSFEKIVHAVC